MDTVFASGLENVHGIAQLADGRVLVTDWDRGLVSAFGHDGSPLGDFATVDDPDAIYQLDDGRVLVAEYNEGTVQAFSPDGTPLGPFASGLGEPAAITQLASGLVLVVQNYPSAVRAFSSAGTDLGTFATSVTEDGTANGVTQLADGRVLVTFGGPSDLSQTVQAFSAGGVYLGAFAGNEHLFAVNNLIQLDDGRILIFDPLGSTFSRIEAYDASGTWLGAFADPGTLISDLTQLADGRVLATGLTEVYAFEPTGVGVEPGASAPGLA